jgi:hypothetical protein
MNYTYIFIISLPTYFFLLSLIIELPSTKVSLFLLEKPIIPCIPSHNVLLLEALVFDRVSNVESDSELKTKAMNFILREVCKKYREGNDPTFSPEEVKQRLKGLGPE